MNYARFNEKGLAAIDKTDSKELPLLVVMTYENRKKMLKPEQHKYVKNLQHWADIFYKIKTKTSRVDKDNTSYIEYIEAVNIIYNEYEKLKQQKLQRQQPSYDVDSETLMESDDKQTPSPEEDMEAYLEGDYPTGYSGKVFSGSGNNKIIVGNSTVTCPGNILSDIS